MKIEAIVTDMDGTLLKRSGGEDHIGERTRKALIAAQESGIRLILASGRPYGRLMRYAEALRMAEHGGWLIEVNGTALYDLAGRHREVLAQLYRSEIKELYTMLVKLEYEVCAYQDSALWSHIPKRLLAAKRAYKQAHGLPQDCPLTAGAFALVSDNRSGYPAQHEAQRWEDLPERMNKLCVADSEERIASAMEMLDTHFHGRFWWGRTSANWLEIMPLHVNKAEGLKQTAARMGIDPSKIMAFGDGENDIGMLKLCGYGYAMGNALDSVKKVAYDVCVSNEEEGVAQIVEQVLRGKEL